MLNGTRRLEKMNGSEVGIVADRWMGWERWRNDAQSALAQMTTRVGLGATCYPSPDGDTCRAGCEPRVQKRNGLEREKT